MDRDLKEEILENTFVARLRLELVVDTDEYARLIDSLRLLAQEWHKRDCIDKELMGDLYVLAAWSRNMVDIMSDQTEQIEEMATEIDALVLDCLAITYTDDDLPRLAKRFGVTEY